MEGLVSDLITKGIEKIASRKNLTSQDLTVLLLHEQGRTMARMEKGMEKLERGVEGLQEGMHALQEAVQGIAVELHGMRQKNNSPFGSVEGHR